jgi:hypothetical protein
MSPQKYNKLAGKRVLVIGGFLVCIDKATIDKKTPKID